MAVTFPSPEWFQDAQFASSQSQEQREASLKDAFDAARGQARLLILDPGLISPVGHHFSHDHALVQATHRLGVPALVIGFRELEERVWQTLPVLRHFHIHPYGKPDVHASAEQDFATLNEIVLRDLVHLPVQVVASDVVLFPTVTQNQLLAIAAWMVQMNAQHRCPHVRIGLMFGPTWSSVFDDVPEQVALYQRAFAAWPPQVKDRVTFLCESETLAKQYRAMTDRPIWVSRVPTVSHFQSIPTTPPDCSTAEFRVGYLGHARKEKGIHFLPDIARYAKITSPNLRFHIQLNYTAEGPYERTARRELEPITNVAPLTLGPLDEAEYAAFIDHCHVVLMPYCPNRYKARGSGLIHEAIQRGRPVVVPANTELGSFVSQSEIGAVFDVYQPASIAHAIQQVALRYDTYVSAVQRTAARRNPVREADEYVNLLRRTQS